MTKYN